DPLAEDIVPIFADARRRLLRPDARLVPRSIDVFVLAVDLPSSFLDAHTFTEANIARWHGTLGFDFAPLAAFGDRVVDLPGVKPPNARSWTAVADPVRLTRVDLANAEEGGDAEVRFVARAPAKHLGFILYFEAELAPGIRLSTAPAAANDDTSWTCRV